MTVIGRPLRFNASSTIRCLLILLVLITAVVVAFPSEARAQSRDKAPAKTVPELHPVTHGPVAPQAGGQAASLLARGSLTSWSDDLPTVTVLSSTSEELILDVTVAGLTTSEIQQGGEVYQHLRLPYSGATTEVGKPELPTFGRFVAVPHGSQVKIEVVQTSSESMDDMLVYPAQEPQPDGQAIESDPPFVIDQDFYTQDTLYPGDLVRVDETKSLRGVGVTVVRFYPYQYNPSRHQLTAYSHLQVRVSFVGSTDSLADERHMAPSFEDFYDRLLLNYELIGDPQQRRAPESANGAQFLIITHPDFEAAANDLAAWRNSQGIDTEVRTTDQTGTTAGDIRTYIQDAYDNWDPAPEFLLLLGDAEFVPTNYENTHPVHATLTGTDLYYVTVDGSDYYPDIHHGRISVDTAAQAQDYIDDIIGYEQNPVADPAFYQNASMVAYFQDDNHDGHSDRRFVLTSEEIRDYLLTEGYAVERIYETRPDVTPTNYNNGTFANGEPLPAELLRTNGFGWDGDWADITDAINTGRFIVVHRDHGSFDEWRHPEYTVSDVETLSNGSKLPVVFSVNCKTGWFDNETDDPEDGTSFSGVSFGEAWQRNQNGGAVGVIAATRSTYSGYNDWLAKGFFDAIWPDFLPHNNTGFSRPEYRMGAVLNYGKLAMATVWGDPWGRQRTHFEAFHYFGDPTTSIHTSLPGVPLAGPTNLLATATSHTEVDLSWQDNSNDETAFHIERSSDQLEPRTFTEIATVDAGVTSYTDSELDAGCGDYYYRVRAYRSGDNRYSAYSSEAHVEVAGCLLEPPTNLSAIAYSDPRVDLTWQDNSSDETAFHIERSSDGGLTYAHVATVGENVQSYSDSGVNCDTTYVYQVRAFRDTDGASSAPSLPDGTTTPPCSLDAPSNLVAAAVSHTEIVLTWEDNSADESAFHIERSEDGESDWAPIDTVDPNAVNYNDTDLVCASAYRYRVRAYRHSDGLFSDHSNESTANTHSCSGPNAITNPGFEEGTNSWSFYTNGSGSFSVAAPGYSGSAAAQISFYAAGSNMQLFQNNIALKPYTDYTLSFYAYSNSGHDLALYLQKHSAPYTNYGLLGETANLSTAWQQFSIDFSTSGFATDVNDGRLRFWFVGQAQPGDIYYVDDVVLREWDPTPSTTLEVIKDVQPDNPGTQWLMSVSGPSPFNDTLAGDDSTGARDVDPGAYQIVESGAGGTNLNDFTASFACTIDSAPGPSGSGDTINLSINEGQSAMCTFTNAAATGTLEVVKDLQPTNDPGKFNLQIDGLTDPDAQNVGHNGSTGAETVAVGSHTVGEVAGSGTDLANYTSSAECRDQGGSGAVVASADDAGPLQVNVGDGDQIVCIISNTRGSGTLEVRKALDPTDDPGKFNLQINGTTDPDAQDAGHNGSTGTEAIAAGTHSVGATAGTGTSLADYTTAIECKDQVGSGSVVAAVNHPGPLDVPVRHGDDVICTISSSRKSDDPGILANPGFEGGTSSWSFYTNGGGSFSATAPGYSGSAAAHLSFNAAGSNMQLFQNNIALKPNTSYNLSFYAYSDSGHDLALYLQKHSAPYTNYGLQSVAVNLFTAWQHFSIDFTTSGFATDVSDGRLRFWFVGQVQPGDTYHIDDVILREQAPTPTTTLEVVKDVQPDDPGSQWLMSVSGPTPFNDTLSGDDSTGARDVTPGDYQIVESGAGGTNLYDYSSSYACTIDAAPGPSGPGDTINLAINEGQSAICTFTNASATGTLEVVKDLQPTDDPGRFNLQIDGATDPDAQNAGHNGSTGAETVAVGNHTVGETAGTGTDLADYASAIECKDQGGTGSVVASANDAGPLQVNVGDGDQIVCTIANTRGSGTLEVRKALDPTDDPGLFNLQIDGTTDPDAQDAGHNGSTGPESVAAGTHSVGETAGSDTSLADYSTAIECKDQGGTGSIVASSNDAGPLNVPVHHGDNVVCIISSIRKSDDPGILANPGFEEGTSAWSFYTNSGGSFSAAAPGYSGSAAAHLSFNSAGSNMQLFQSGIPLKPNTDYTLSFYAYSNSGHDLALYLQKHSAPYTNYGLQGEAVNLSTTWQRFSIDFSTSGFATDVSDGRLRFWFVGQAMAGDVYHIDDVVLQERP